MTCSPHEVTFLNCVWLQEGCGGYFASLVCLHVMPPEQLDASLAPWEIKQTAMSLSKLRGAIRANLQAVLQAAAAGQIQNSASVAKADVLLALGAARFCIPDIAAGKGLFTAAADQVRLLQHAAPIIASCTKAPWL